MVEKMKVAVDGATGYLGSHLISKLCKSAVNVLALVHPGAKEIDRKYLHELGANIIEVDLSKKSAKSRNYLDGTDVVVHLIGSIAPQKGMSLAHLHVEQTNNLVALAKEAKVKKIVMVTALGSDEQAESSYHRTKFQAEKCVINSGIDYVILRPSLIVGQTQGRRNSKLVTRYLQFIKTKAIVPLIGDGNNKIQPVFIDDLVEALVLAIEKNDFNGQILEIGGLEVLSLREFVKKLMTVMAEEKKLCTVPFFIAKPMARLLEAVQNQPTVSVDQVIMSAYDNVCDDNALVTKFALRPKSLL